MLLGALESSSVGDGDIKVSASADVNGEECVDEPQEPLADVKVLVDGADEVKARDDGAEACSTQTVTDDVSIDSLVNVT